jgi:hypothetical protein
LEGTIESTLEVHTNGVNDHKLNDVTITQITNHLPLLLLLQLTVISIVDVNKPGHQPNKRKKVQIDELLQLCFLYLPVVDEDGKQLLHCLEGSLVHEVDRRDVRLSKHVSELLVISG